MHFSRPLIPCILAYSCGLWLVHEIYHTAPAVALVIGGVVAAVTLGLARWRRELTPLYLLAIFCAGALVMGLREREFRAAAEIAAKVAGPQLKQVSGTVASAEEDLDGTRGRVVLNEAEILNNGRGWRVPGKILVTMAAKRGKPPLRVPVVGERLAFAGQVEQPAALHNFFGYDRTESLRHRQIYLTARVVVSGDGESADSASALRVEAESLMAKAGEYVSHVVREKMWPREARLMVAMLLNDMRHLSDEEMRVFRRSGTLHLFAVSGMHVAILGLVLQLLFRVMRVKLRTSWLLVAVVLYGYLWMIGFVPSAMRAYLMLVAFTAAYIIGREVDPLTCLVFAVAVVIGFEPSAVWEPGFILSVMGVAAIILFVPLMELWIMPQRDIRALPWPKLALFRGAEAAITAVTVAVILLPIQLYYFGYWNWFSPLANVLQAGLSSLVLSAGVFTVAVAELRGGIGRAAGSSASVLMQVVYEISRWTAGREGAIMTVRQLPVSLLFIAYGILLGGFYMAYEDSPLFRLKSRARFAVHAVCSLGLIAVYTQVQAVPKGQLEVVCLDVGQGDATFIRFPNGQSMLIDGGMGEPDMGALVVAPQLRALGVSRLDYVVATHDDSDHTGGLATVIRELGAGNILLPSGFRAQSDSSQDLLAAAKEKFCVVSEVAQGTTADCGGVQLEVLNPETSGSETASDNDGSIVFRLQYGRFSALFTGDAGQGVEARLAQEGRLEPLTLLKVAHHGSRFSTTDAFVERVNPQVATISCGARNNFGHPNGAVLQRLMRAGSKVCRTDKDGAIWITTDGEKLDVRTCVN